MAMGIFEQLDWLTKKVKQLCCIVEQGGGGGGADITVQDQGSTLTTALTLLNFTGDGVTATNTGSAVQVTIPGSTGITRSVNNIGADTTAGNAANTDYFYFITATTTLTMPTASGNDNMYYVKSIGTDPVTIAAAGSETIDGSGSIVLNVQYQAVTLKAMGGNWYIL